MKTHCFPYPPISRYLMAIVFLMLGLSASTGVWAMAIYDATAQATLRVTGVRDSTGALITPPTGLTWSGNASPFGESTFTDGNATATASGTQTGGDSLAQTARIGGSASAPYGLSGAQYLTDGFFSIANNSGMDVTLDFALDYAWSIQVGVDDPLTELAIAEIYIFSDSLLLGDLLEIEAWLDTDLLGGAGMDSDTGTLLFSLAVADASVLDDEIYLQVDASYGLAFAESVPEPGTLVLLAIGFGGLALQGRRRRG